MGIKKKLPTSITASRIILAVMLAACLLFAIAFINQANQKKENSLKAAEMALVPDDCIYRYNHRQTDDFLQATYKSIEETGFKLYNSLLNDLHYYNPDFVYGYDCKTVKGYTCMKQENILTYYIEKKAKRNIQSAAVILLHGNSSLPEDFINGSNTYLNNVGTILADHGYDIYAPYVTHLSNFQNARRRLASMQNKKFDRLDIERTKAILKKIAPHYEKIHLVGVSYGGHLAVRTYGDLLESHPNLKKKIGTVVSFEGYIPSRKFIENDSDLLFHWNWEMVFPGTRRNDYIRTLNDPKVIIAQGSCSMDQESINAKSDNHVISYEGGHEIKPDLLLEILKEGSGDHHA